MKSIGVKELKKYLSELDKRTLEEEIVNLFKSQSSVKEFYSSKLNPESENIIFEKYKRIIEREFTPTKNSVSLNYKNCRNAIKDFQKVCTQKNLIADLMFCYAEAGIDFTNDFGSINEQFYNNIISAYYNALKYAFENDIEESYKDKACKLMEDAQGIGWGFGEELADIYYNYYQYDEE